MKGGRGEIDEKKEVECAEEGLGREASEKQEEEEKKEEVKGRKHKQNGGKGGEFSATALTFNLGLLLQLRFLVLNGFWKSTCNVY